MRTLLFSAAVLAAVTACTARPSEEEANVKLPVTALSVPEVTPWIEKAARELGHTRVRAYQNGVFIDVAGDTISFFREKNGMTMHVGLESKYEHAKSDRAAALKDLQVKGDAIFQQALSLQARSHAESQMAQRPAPSPAG
jgi:hypothetical protein